jgi:hypothetical protein
MQNKANQNKEFRTLCPSIFLRRVTSLMQKPKSIRELMGVPGQRLTALKAQNDARKSVMEQVCAALPPNLAKVVVSAGIEKGRLTIGVAEASWAARLRYVTDALRQSVAPTLGVEIYAVRVRVVPPRSAVPAPAADPRAE